MFAVHYDTSMKAVCDASPPHSRSPLHAHFSRRPLRPNWRRLHGCLGSDSESDELHKQNLACRRLLTFWLFWVIAGETACFPCRPGFSYPLWELFFSRRYQLGVDLG